MQTINIIFSLSEYCSLIYNIKSPHNDNSKQIGLHVYPMAYIGLGKKICTSFETILSSTEDGLIYSLFKLIIVF